MGLRTTLLLFLLPAGLAGCLAGDAACLEPAVEALTPWVGRDYLATDPAQPWDSLVLVENATQGDELGFSAGAAPGWSALVESLGASATFQRLRVAPEPGPSGAVRLNWTLERREDGCRAGTSGKLAWSLDPPTEGDSAQPGQGVHVYTAGFWENGTLFYTNIEALDASAWPRAGWYAWEGGEALRVYVYDTDRSEMPAVWNPAAGTPVDGAGPWAYYTTIPGFNEALKGLSTHTTRVVRLAPEEAYTRAGNEEHPLYGDALVFYIQVERVVDLPCPEGAAATGCRLSDAAAWPVPAVLP